MQGKASNFHGNISAAMSRPSSPQNELNLYAIQGTEVTSCLIISNCDVFRQEEADWAADGKQ